MTIRIIDLNIYVMQTKLTLRIEDVLIRKAKRLASQRGTSVSRIFSEYINEQPDVPCLDELPPITEAMVGVIKRKGAVAKESDYQKYLEEKYL